MSSVAVPTFDIPPAAAGLSVTLMFTEEQHAYLLDWQARAAASENLESLLLRTLVKAAIDNRFHALRSTHEQALEAARIEDVATLVTDHTAKTTALVPAPRS